VDEEPPKEPQVRTESRTTYLRLEAFRVAFDTIKLGIVVWDHRGQIVAISSEASKIAGLSEYDQSVSPETWTSAVQVCYPDGRAYPPGKDPFRVAFVERKVVSGARLGLVQVRTDFMVPVIVNAMPLFDREDFVGAVMLIQRLD